MLFPRVCVLKCVERFRAVSIWESSSLFLGFLCKTVWGVHHRDKCELLAWCWLALSKYLCVSFTALPLSSFLFLSTLFWFWPSCNKWTLHAVMLLFKSLLSGLKCTGWTYVLSSANQCCYVRLETHARISSADPRIQSVEVSHFASAWKIK